MHLSRSVWKSFVRRQSVRSLTNAAIGEHRLKIFEREKNEQLAKMRRVEKIEVTVDESDESKKLVMNKGLSTPLDCARHLSSVLVQRSALAVLDNVEVWDMNRPLERDCRLRFLHFLDENPLEQNRAYWRTCSFITGFLLESSFKPEIRVELCSFPSPQFHFGSFVYDAKIALGDRPLTDEELRCLSIQVNKLVGRDLRFERLEISESVGKEMFQHDRFKVRQIPSMVRSLREGDEQKRLVVYRLGAEHVDICRGPLICSTGQLGRFELSSVHRLDVRSYAESMWRVQGLSIPAQLQLHYWTFAYLLRRAKLFNRSPLPAIDSDDRE